ncbi:hypothetical protein [Jeotgalibacillus sp. JSM ZJ347]|uniref:hypothetical protein n=1 Tax=Jeotgalibacillus sp. JSM ZJ347 TaxID=3342117 RepID=UPI0035A978F5
MRNFVLNLFVFNRMEGLYESKKINLCGIFYYQSDSLFSYLRFHHAIFNGGSILESGDTALSNIAIYSVTLAICWLISSDKLEEAIETDRKAKEESQV